MYAYSSFPSRFAVFRGPYHSTLRTELVDSIMLFESTPSVDNSFYTATLRPWTGTIVGNDYPPDKTVRMVKIHSPSRKNHHGHPFSPSNVRFVVLPFCVEDDTTMPILAFECTNWMPRVEQVDSIHLKRNIQCESFKYHYQNIHYIADMLMRTNTPSTPFIPWLRSLTDPYTVTNHVDIRVIPYSNLSPTTIYNLRRDVIDDIYRHNVATVAEQLVGAILEGATEEVLAEGEYMDSIFDAAAGYVAPEEPSLSTTIPAFILMNHLAHEVQKGTTCPITFEPLSNLAQVAMSPDCGHFFQEEALKAWGNVQQSAGAAIVCPVCRTALNQVVTMTNNSYIPPVVA